MNNTFYDEANKIEYIIPAPRQLSRQEAELAHRQRELPNAEVQSSTTSHHVEDRYS